MHTFFKALTALFLAACSPPAAPSRADLAAAEASTVALVNEWAATGTEGRWDDLVALYGDLPGFVWVEQGDISYPDHAAIAEGVANAQRSGLPVQTTVNDVHATALAADAAVARANVSIVFGGAAEGFRFDGVMTAVAVKRDGRWVFLQGHLSSPTGTTNAQ